MTARYCYWSVVDGPYAAMMESVILSARAVGVFKDFHIWADRPVGGAINHPARKIDKAHYLFKFAFLRKFVKKLNYDYFIWLDADTWFVRDPGDILRVMHLSPVHSSLECNACNPRNVRQDWWGCPLSMYARLMRVKGVNSDAIFNVNAGFWIVHHDVIDLFCDLAAEFWQFTQKVGYTDFTEEPPLAYATHMLCGNPYLHTLANTSDVWASDWVGTARDALPDGRPWATEDYFTGEPLRMNPAIVHAMRCKHLLEDPAKLRSELGAAWQQPATGKVAAHPVNGAVRNRRGTSQQDLTRLPTKADKARRAKPQIK